MLPRSFHYGVHLGMTTAAIARCAGAEVVVIQNTEKKELTPVAVWLDPHGSLLTGRAAQDGCESDPENGFIGFTCDLGTDTDYLFARSGRQMRSEDLCAVVLKSLRTDAEQEVGGSVTVTDCVLTVPIRVGVADQELYRRAARLAGFTTVHLLPECIAAAIAHGFGKKTENGHLLVYNFGETSFEATLLRLDDDLISVLAFDGDLNHGWQDIIRVVVEGRLIPMMIRQRLLELLSAPRKSDTLGLLTEIMADARIHFDDFSGTSAQSMNKQIDLLAQLYPNEQHWERLTVLVGLTGFRWENPRWSKAMLNLRVLADACLLFAGHGCSQLFKKDLPKFCFDDKNAPVDLSVQLECGDLKDLAAPFILKTVCISRNILERRGVAASELQKIVPLGSATRQPIIWQNVEKGIGSVPDFTVDPETAVVRGAAIHAAMLAESDLERKA